MKLHERIPLPNGLILEIWDRTRKIAEDTYRVELAAQIEVPFQPSYFLQKEHYEKTVKTLGQTGLYEYRKERTFVKVEDKDRVFEELLESFKRDTLQYLSREDFPQRFARAQYRDIEKNWYKYVTPKEEEE
ncbi:MAG: hypothetical protein N2317_05205 [Syntrophales bacterium]|nr:hypothetical protein [Syntrophales bacterium]